MNSRLDYSKYRGKGQPRKMDYIDSSLSHEVPRPSWYDWTIAFLLGVIIIEAALIAAQLYTIIRSI